MKILHTNMLRGWGGQSNRILVEALGAKREGHDVAVAVPRGAQLGVRAKLAGLTVFPQFQFRSPILLWHFWQDLQDLRRVIDDWRPDIIHTHGSQDTWVTVVAKARAREKFPPVIRTKHNIFEWKRSWPNKWLYRHIDAFVSISGFIDQQVAAFPGAGDKPRMLIPSVPDRTALEKSHPSLRGEIPGLTQDTFLWGSTGRLRSEKGFDVLLRAMERLRRDRPDAFLVIAGDGSDRGKLEQQAKELGLGPDAVCFLGFREDVPALLQSLDAYVLASRSEGLGTAILEALCVGLPVVATHVGGIPDSITHEQTGLLVPSENDIVLASAMKRVMEDRELRERLKVAARQKVLYEFTEERLVERTMKFYLEVFKRANQEDNGVTADQHRDI
ncbi:glycosyltransferase family 4 protein [Candidatus Sumerlaeota bacterium]|nr:glycosyltransferase family 4 protein [Candidatus Sumerlaeota bacterium]